MYTNQDVYILTETIKKISSGFNFIVLKLEDKDGCLVDYESIIEEKGYNGALLSNDTNFFMVTFFMELMRNKENGPKCFVTLYPNGEINVAPTKENTFDFDKEKVKNQVKEILIEIKEERMKRELNKQVDNLVLKSSKEIHGVLNQRNSYDEKFVEKMSRKIAEELNENRRK